MPTYYIQVRELGKWATAAKTKSSTAADSLLAAYRRYYGYFEVRMLRNNEVIA